VVFETLILKLLCFSLNLAEVSLSKWAYLVSRWLTPHKRGVGPEPAYSVEKLVYVMSGFATLILIRGFCSG